MRFLCDRSLSDNRFTSPPLILDLPLHRIARGWWQNGYLERARGKMSGISMRSSGDHFSVHPASMCTGEAGAALATVRMVSIAAGGELL
jgi:hypothetical protein